MTAMRKTTYSHATSIHKPLPDRPNPSSAGHWITSFSKKRKQYLHSWVEKPHSLGVGKKVSGQSRVLTAQGPEKQQAAALVARVRAMGMVRAARPQGKAKTYVTRIGERVSVGVVGNPYHGHEPGERRFLAQTKVNSELNDSASFNVLAKAHKYAASVYKMNAREDGIRKGKIALSRRRRVSKI